jgi:hypothetical protein
VADAAAAGEGDAALDSQQTASGRALRKVSELDCSHGRGRRGSTHHDPARSGTSRTDRATRPCAASASPSACLVLTQQLALNTIKCCHRLMHRTCPAAAAAVAVANHALLVSLQRPRVQPPSSQAARAATSLALSVVGKRVEVWWEDDQQYYAGRITHYNTGAQYARAPRACCMCKY